MTERRCGRTVKIRDSTAYGRAGSGRAATGTPNHEHHRNRRPFTTTSSRRSTKPASSFEGWEVKAIRAGRSNIKRILRGDPRRGDLCFRHAHHPAQHRLQPCAPRPDARTRKPGAAQEGDRPPDRQGRARRLYAAAARPALQEWAREVRDRARQGRSCTTSEDEKKDWEREKQRLMRVKA